MDELGRAVRSARRALGSAASQEPAQPAHVPWAELGLAGWKKFGALSLFRMRVGGAVLFTEARDVARPGTGADGDEQILVQVRDAAGAD
eukprot:4290849-Pleurochrysis_carterae.AAC.1